MLFLLIGNMVTTSPPSNTILPLSFYDRPTLVVAKELLGKYLVCADNNTTAAYMITEVEAYDGHDDRASHTWKGVTRRTKVMFGPAGHWYVYLVYGMHWMLNIVTGPIGYPAAVLIRGAGPFDGPAKMTKALSIDARFNTLPATRETGLWIEDRGGIVTNIITTPRIGVSYAGPEWAAKPYRFLIDPNP